MPHQRVLERHRGDPLAAGLDEVLVAVLDLDVPVGMDSDDVARLEPAVVRPAVAAVGRLVVGGGDRRAAHLELAHARPVPRHEPVRRGGAAPPTVIVRIDDRSQPPGFASSACRMPSQIVGTPAATVTCSVSNASRRLTASRCGPGNTCLAPTIVQLKGKHQALAWNIGTTGSTTSAVVRPTPGAIVSAWSAIARGE